MALDQVDVDNLPSGEEGGEEKEMTFLEHLEELRWHIIRAVIAIIVVGIALFVGQQWVFGTVILGPTKPDFFPTRLFVVYLS